MVKYEHCSEIEWFVKVRNVTISPFRHVSVIQTGYSTGTLPSAPVTLALDILLTVARAFEWVARLTDGTGFGYLFTYPDDLDQSKMPKNLSKMLSEWEGKVPWQKPFSEEPFQNVKEPFQNVIGMRRKGSLAKSFHGGTFLCQKERFKKAFLGEFGTFLWRFWNLSSGSFLVQKNLSFQICPTGQDVSN